MNQDISIETDVSILELDPKGFLRITLKETDNQLDADEAIRQIAAAQKLTNGERHLVLVDATKSFIVPTLEAKKILSEVNKKIKEAVVIKSLGSRIAGNIYIRISGGKYPTKLFNNEESAIKWLFEK